MHPGWSISKLMFSRLFFCLKHCSKVMGETLTWDYFLATFLFLFFQKICCLLETLDYFTDVRCLFYICKCIWSFAKKTLIIRQTMNDSKPIINLYEHFKCLPADALSLSAIFPFGADESYKIIFQLVPTIMLLRKTCNATYSNKLFIRTWAAISMPISSKTWKYKFEM